jgi:hypothetical protein
MAYAKGEILVSKDRDIPLLRQVRNCRFITRAQLFEFLQPCSAEYSRKSFDWRFLRLLRANYLARVEGHFGRGNEVYRVTSAGLLLVEGGSEYAMVLNSKTKQSANAPFVYHALELNSIQLDLKRANLLAGWQSDVETASFNMAASNPLKKNYDAVVDVWLENRTSARFGLEYERSLKGLRHYGKIRDAIESEDSLGCVLYLTPGHDMALYLAKEFAGISNKVAFADVSTFRKHLLDTLVLTQPSQNDVPFRHLLRGMF